MKRTCVSTALAVCSLFFNIAALAQEAATDQNQTAPPPATVTGSGTANYIPMWTGSSSLGNSKLFQTGGKIGVNTTIPAVQLDVNGRINTSKSYQIGARDVLIVPGTNGLGVGLSALPSVTTGRDNVAVGGSALGSVTSGEYNTAVGVDALFLNNGDGNTGLGHGVLSQNTSGTDNTATGVSALYYNTIGSYNTANGDFALFQNTMGGSNTAVGYQALVNNTTGANNIALGYGAAMNVAAGGINNIHIGNYGASGDNGVIRLGTSGFETSFFAAGVNGVTTGLNDAVPVVIDSNGQLGTITSSRRFKEDIHDMGDASEGLMQLRPVTFRYQKPFADGSQPLQYGLVAEEVAEVYPDLVTHSADGQIQSVKYQVLDSMLLNEVQRQRSEIRSLQERLEKMEAALPSISQAK